MRHVRPLTRAVIWSSPRASKRADTSAGTHRWQIYSRKSSPPSASPCSPQEASRTEPHCYASSTWAQPARGSEPDSWPPPRPVRTRATRGRSSTPRPARPRSRASSPTAHCSRRTRGRVCLRACIDSMHEAAGPVIGTTTFGTATVDVTRGSGMPPGLTSSGNVEAMAMYAGHSVAAIAGIEPAGTVVKTLWPEHNPYDLTRYVYRSFDALRVAHELEQTVIGCWIRTHHGGTAGIASALATTRSASSPSTRSESRRRSQRLPPGSRFSPVR